MNSLGVVDEVQAKVVKIYGAGGFRGLEPWQSGFVVSADGYIVTAWSYVLDTEPILVHLKDGRRFDGKLVGADPRLDLAVLKIDAKDLPYFDLDNAVEGQSGLRVLAFSNLYNVATGNEPVSVQHGVISVKTRLEARRGVFKTPFRGDVYVLDAVTNNPGAAGGALVNYQGEFLAMLGKELRNSLNHTWLNYAIPAEAFRQKVQDIMEGKGDPITPDVESGEPKADNPLTLDLLGIVLVPNVVERTPPFVDAVRAGSVAKAAGVLPDDLVVYIRSRTEHPRLIQTCRTLLEELSYIDRDDTITLTIIRGDDIVRITLKAN